MRYLRPITRLPRSTKQLIWIFDSAEMSLTSPTISHLCLSVRVAQIIGGVYNSQGLGPASHKTLVRCVFFTENRVRIESIACGMSCDTFKQLQLRFEKHNYHSELSTWRNASYFTHGLAFVSERSSAANYRGDYNSHGFGSTS